METPENTPAPEANQVKATSGKQSLPPACNCVVSVDTQSRRVVVNLPHDYTGKVPPTIQAVGQTGELLVDTIYQFPDDAQLPTEPQCYRW